MKMFQEPIIVKSNELIEARFDLSLLQKKVFLVAISLIEEDDKPSKLYRVPIRFLVENSEVSSSATNSRIKSQLKSMMQQIIELPHPEGKSGWMLVSLFAMVRYATGSGFIEIRFHEELKPYLFQLKSKFTVYELRYALRLHSVYAIRIYELLKQYEKIGSRTFTVDELRAMFRLEGKYENYNGMRERVILQAKKQISEYTDIDFDFEEIKEGKKVVSIKFLIKKKKNLAEIDKADNATIAEALSKVGVSEAGVKKILNEHHEEYIDFILKKVKEKKNIQNIPAFLIESLKEQYFIHDYELHCQKAHKIKMDRQKLTILREEERWKSEFCNYIEKRYEVYLRHATEVHRTEYLAYLEEMEKLPHAKIWKMKEDFLKQTNFGKTMYAQWLIQHYGKPFDKDWKSYREYVLQLNTLNKGK